MNEESVLWALQSERGTWRRATGEMQQHFLKLAVHRFRCRAELFEAWDWFEAGWRHE
jgi:hypothetical protein